MRVLITEDCDGSLRVVEVSSAGFDPAEHKLWIKEASSNLTWTTDMGVYEAEAIIKVLYREGRYDLKDSRFEVIIA